MSRIASLVAAALITSAVTPLLACTGASQDGLHDTEEATPSAPANDATGATSAATTSPDAGADSGPQPTIGGAVRQADQFKSSAELRQAIAVCLGTSLTTVSAGMLQTAGGTSVTGFLSPTDFAAGDDVITQQVLIFDGDPAVARTGVRTDTVSLPLLAALQNVGNVVGGNCAVQLAAANATSPDAGTPPLCACSTHDTALAMLGRCLPSVDPSAYASVVDSFASACASDDAAAVASLVASTTFGAQ